MKHRWARWRDAETVIVWDARLGGIPVCLIGIESKPLPRQGFVPAAGPIPLDWRLELYAGAAHVGQTRYARVDY